MKICKKIQSVAVLFLTTFLVTHAAVAQTAPYFKASPERGPSPLATTLTWDVPGALSCTAGDTYGWRGPVTTSGTAKLSGIKSTKLTVTLNCTMSGSSGGTGSIDKPITWTWTPQFTDGTPVTNVAGFNIHYGQSASALASTVQLPNSGLRTYTTTLAPGTWYFAVTVYLQDGTKSALSNVVSRTVQSTAAQPFNASIDLIADKMPTAPVIVP